MHTLLKNEQFKNIWLLCEKPNFRSTNSSRSYLHFQRLLTSCRCWFLWLDVSDWMIFSLLFFCCELTSPSHVLTSYSFQLLSQNLDYPWGLDEIVNGWATAFLESLTLMRINFRLRVAGIIFRVVCLESSAPSLQSLIESIRCVFLDPLPGLYRIPCGPFYSRIDS